MDNFTKYRELREKQKEFQKNIDELEKEDLNTFDEVELYLMAKDYMDWCMEAVTQETKELSEKILIW